MFLLNFNKSILSSEKSYIKQFSNEEKIIEKKVDEIRN